MGTVNLIATAPMGLEALVGREVKDLGYEGARVENGRVRFAGDESAICRANLWLRTADRVLVEVGEFTATSFEQLFERTRALPWDEWIARDGNFVVEGKSHQSQLSSVPACQSIVEKAVVERLKQRHNLEWFPKTGARYTIQVALVKDVATLTLDTSGPGLHKRGYRDLTATAPIKETLAASMILLSRWHPDRPFLDPLCGSGTFPIEAALIGHNIAPGLSRTFAAEGWERLPKDLWQRARDEAHDRADFDRPVEITGADNDPEVLKLARRHVRAAGLTRSVKLCEQPLSATSTEFHNGYLITNPPYGERLGEQAEVEALYRELGLIARALKDWSVFVITPDVQFERLFGRQADKRRKLYNGRIECQLYQYHGPYHARPVPATGE